MVGGETPALAKIKRWLGWIRQSENKKCRHSRAGENFVWYLEMIVKTNHCLSLTKIPACAGMTESLSCCAIFRLPLADLAKLLGEAGNGGDFAFAVELAV